MLSQTVVNPNVMWLEGQDPLLRSRDGSRSYICPSKAPNPIRNGIDPAFETDPLYLDVTNNLTRINTATPTRLRR